MAESKEKVKLYKEEFISQLEKTGWNLSCDASYFLNFGDGLLSVICLSFKKGNEEKTIHYLGTVRDTLTFFVGAYNTLTYFVEQ